MGQLDPGTGRGSINWSIILGSITGMLNRGSFIVGITAGAAPALLPGQIDGAEIAAPAAAPVFKSCRLVSMVIVSLSLSTTSFPFF